MVTKSREDIYEDAEIAHDLEDFFDEEEKGLQELANPNAEASRLVKDISDPTRLVRVYVTTTGEPRDVPKWTLDGRNSILRRRNNEGGREFSLRKPAGVTWEPGNVMCLLHPNHPRRAEFDAMGLRGKTCGALTGKHAGNLASEFSLDIHMAHRHQAEWSTIQRAEARIREEEYREFQRVQTQAARMAVEGSSKGRKGPE